LAIGVASGIIFRFGASAFTFFYDRWVGFITASLLMSIVQACYVYAASFRNGKLLALGGNSGNPLFDVGVYLSLLSIDSDYVSKWFIGRELNPSIGSFDIKSFNEIRPGLILWVLIDISMACEQALRIGTVTDSMALVLAFHGYYVLDAVFNEVGPPSFMATATLS
jgi:Delta14-sterol reductase